MRHWRPGVVLVMLCCGFGLPMSLRVFCSLRGSAESIGELQVEIYTKTLDSDMYRTYHESILAPMEPHRGQLLY